MGCTCCKMLERPEPGERQLKGYVNEAHSFNEYDRSKLPTVKISDLVHEEPNRFIDSHDLFNGTEKTNHKHDTPVTNGPSTIASQCPILNNNTIGETKEYENYSTETDSSKGNSEGRESIEHASPCENNSFCENVISIVNSDLLLNPYDVTADSDTPNAHADDDKDHILETPNEPSLVAHLIQRISSRVSKIGLENEKQNEETSQYEELHPDVAEALAVLDSVIEQFENEKLEI
ncbi:uncharacterized protein LOC128472977 [Spea bombifrons]|uniref:uncharacterized protein LOC128472977 n=1 Tax=Spea bombifrons TaxID=233779 RepID=UPI00234BB6A3|nr:uncharacterized protein LOC128472977 [Spea bombifrons]